MSVQTKLEAGTSQTVRDLRPMFSPRSIAVVGASRTDGNVGNAVVRNLIFGGFTGVVYPVNPKAKGVFGCPCYPSLTEIGEAVDLAVVVVPSHQVERVVEEAANMGTRNILVISAGFKEIGGDGVERESRISSLASQRGLNIVGPNCLGIINTHRDIRMNASFSKGMPPTGSLGLISQSGALCTAILDYAAGQGIGFSRVVSFGNKCDLTEVELLQSLADDPNTKVILMYVEDLSDGQAFVDTAHRITSGDRPTPILAIKTGRTAQGAAAAASHTGSLAGSDEVYDAIMTQAGVIRVDSVQDLFDFAEVFGDPSLPEGRRTAIVTNAGGPGIMATDACIRYGLELASFREYTLKSLRFQMPPTASLKNPVDVIGDAKHDRYRAALDAVTSDEGVDQVCVIVTPQTMTDVIDIAKVVAETKDFCPKPIVGCMMGHLDISPGLELLKSRGVPAYTFPEVAMRAMAAKARFSEWKKAPIREIRQFDVDKDAVRRVFEEERKAGRTQLVEVKALDIFSHYGFSTVPYKLAPTADEAVAAAEDLGYPVVLKISGPKILHKTDVGGVKLKLKTADAVRDGFNEMIASVKAKMGDDVEIWGVLVQKMLNPGKEIILGVSRDLRFGPLLMFGLGGIYTEALRDVSFRLAPIRENEAMDMIHAIRSIKLLEGVRGEPPSDLEGIAECLLRLSQLVTDHPDITELDMNPLIVYAKSKGTVVADARIILSEK